MESSSKNLIARTLKKLKELTNWSEEKTITLSETIALNLKKLPELKHYINENNKENESKIYFEMGRYLKYSRYKKGQFIKHSYDSDNFFYMIFSGSIAKIDIKYTRSYLTFKEYLIHLIKLKLLGENYIYKRCLKRNKKVFPFDENIDVLVTKDINMDHYDELIKKIKNEIKDSPWNQNTDEVNKVSDFIELYNPNLSNNKLSFFGKESKYPVYMPIYVFDKILNPISFIGELTKPKGIKMLSAYVCLSASSVFYINKTKIDRNNNLYTLFQRRVSEEVVEKLFEGHFLFQDTDVNFLSKNYSKYFFIKNYIKGQKLIQQNTPNEGIYFINKGVFQLKARRTYHELNELKFKAMQSLTKENKNNLTGKEKTSKKNYENIYEGLNPYQIANLTKEREINFMVYKSSDVIGLDDVYDIKTGLNNFSVECISDEGEAYFLPKEIVTSMRTNETIDNNIRELVGKQCLELLREINENKKMLENSIRRITSGYKEKNNNVFYLRKNTDNNKNLHTISHRNPSLDYSSLSNYNNMKTFTSTNYSNNYIYTIKENSLKNKILNNHFNKTPKITASRIFSPKILPNKKGANLNLKLKTYESNEINKFKDQKNDKIQSLSSVNPFLTYREKFKAIKILNEENKNEIKNDNKFASLNPKLEYKNILTNQNKVSNIYRLKSGNKKIIKNIILKERKSNSKLVKVIYNSLSDKKLINKKIYIKSSE